MLYSGILLSNLEKEEECKMHASPCKVSKAVYGGKEATHKGICCMILLIQDVLCEFKNGQNKCIVIEIKSMVASKK